LDREAWEHREIIRAPLSKLVVVVVVLVGQVEKDEIRLNLRKEVVMAVLVCQIVLLVLL
jgi:hypothetical protein